MPDIAELLDLAARRPAVGPDLDAVSSRAASQRRSVAVARAGAAALVVAALVPFVLSPDGPQSLSEVEVPAGPRPTTTQVVTGPPTGAPGPAPGIAAPVVTDAAVTPRPVPDRAPGRTPRATSEPTATTSPRPVAAPPAQGGAEPAQSCEVTTAGLAPTLTATCAFTATRAGGYAATYALGAGTVNDEGNTVTVTRQGQPPVVYDINENSSAGCRDAVIEPGDVVEVSVHQAERGYVELELGAGLGYGCQPDP